MKHHFLETKVLCRPLSLTLVAFPISHSLHTKGHAGSEKKKYILKFHSKFLLSNCTTPNIFLLIVYIANYANISHTQSKWRKNKIVKDKVFFFNHRTSFDTKGPISPSTGRISNKNVIVVTFARYIHTFKTEPCTSLQHLLCLYDTLRTMDRKFWVSRNPCHRQWNRFYNKNITLCHLYDLKQKPKTSPASLG